MSGLYRKDWEENPVLKAVCHAPYQLCFSHVLWRLSEWSREHTDGEPIAIVVAEQREYQEFATTIYEEYKNSKDDGCLIASLQFADAKDFPGLQAADLLCYEMYKQLRIAVAKLDAMAVTEIEL